MNVNNLYIHRTDTHTHSKWHRYTITSGLLLIPKFTQVLITPHIRHWLHSKSRWIMVIKAIVSKTSKQIIWIQNVEMYVVDLLSLFHTTFYKYIYIHRVRVYSLQIECLQILLKLRSNRNTILIFIGNFIFRQRLILIQDNNFPWISFHTKWIGERRRKWNKYSQ